MADCLLPLKKEIMCLFYYSTEPRAVEHSGDQDNPSIIVAGLLWAD